MQRKIPDLPDLQRAGMGITEALAYWNAMMNAPDRDATDWWADLAQYMRRREINRRRVLQ